jgi:hypothetical protein
MTTYRGASTDDVRLKVKMPFVERVLDGDSETLFYQCGFASSKRIQRHVAAEGIALYLWCRPDEGGGWDVIAISDRIG